ncbi:arginyltransferase [Desulfurivibrio alkaliphilus]|uniref:Aspartate/glutamate leucyltransferase n=1 Tax=Desulfurivibrio alkaliphilus (strain DSM 19089 / UNIQEM U267 / AHT2) TaxID=589865 RepID=D6Z2A5_DESAT|nr:arginyltransferase [Desulfurivibrio alkaliphilus]ADH85680.1 Arginyltransferase [Desulfurivibrio alkaliphilus AHT 2]
MRDYLFDIAAECPYGLQSRAVYRQSPCPPLSGEMFDDYLQAGFRRNGNIMYTMACPNCQACVPIRLAVRDFRPNRNQRRIWRRNQDVRVSQGPLQLSAEKLELCERFLACRYPDQECVPGSEGVDGRAVDYYGGFFLNSITDTWEIAYRVEERLLGLAVVDIAPTALNAVYFYFDPDQAHRSPGILNILSLIQLCRQVKLEHLYLGYWIKEVPAMSYKSRFKPHQLLLDGHWQTITRN